MRRWIIPFYTVALLFLAAEQSGAQEQKTPAPRIVCDQPTYNFGEADNNQTIEHVFVLRNEGDIALEITSVRATCGCTATDVSQRFVDPGESTELKAKLDLRGRQGRQRKAIMVQSNDPQVPTLTLYFDGTAVTDLQMNPRQIFFGRITPDAVVTGTVELAVRGDKPVSLLKLESSTTMLTATNIPLPDGVSQQIAVVTVPPLPQGALRGNIRMETDSKTHPALDLVVSGFVVSELSFAPHEIVLPENPEGSELRYLLCRSESAKEFEIVSVELPDPGMEAQVQPSGPSAYRIAVRNIRPTLELNGQVIRVNTTLEAAKTFSVPFRVVPQNGR